VKDAFARQTFLGAGSAKVLRVLRAGIVGLGGGGSHVAQQLAHLGVGQFVLLDPDRIDVSNLNRLVGGTVADVRSGRRKVSIASRVISGVNPSATIVAEAVKWQERAELLRDCDIVVGCVDNFAARDELERAARRYLTPYIDIGMDVHNDGGRYSITGQVALSMPSEPCLHCMNVLRPDLIAREAGKYGAAGGRPQVVWPNGVLASMAVGIIVQLVTPWDTTRRPPHLLEYDGNVPEIRPAASSGFLTDRPCPHFTEVADIGDPWFGQADASK
jgi:hypothetical protein